MFGYFLFRETPSSQHLTNFMLETNMHVFPISLRDIDHILERQFYFCFGNLKEIFTVLFCLSQQQYFGVVLL